MPRSRFVAITVLILAIVGIVIGYSFYVSTSSSESKAVNISRQSPAVQRFISLHPNAEYKVMKLYVGSDGSVYTIYSDWELDRCVGSVVKPTDGVNHYCWSVHWSDPKSGTLHIVDVFVDKDSWEIVLVEEAE